MYLETPIASKPLNEEEFQMIKALYRRCEILQNHANRTLKKIMLNLMEFEKGKWVGGLFERRSKATKMLGKFAAQTFVLSMKALTFACTSFITFQHEFDYLLVNGRVSMIHDEPVQIHTGFSQLPDHNPRVGCGANCEH